jgi:hypothetical protein
MDDKEEEHEEMLKDINDQMTMNRARENGCLTIQGRIAGSKPVFLFDKSSKNYLESDAFRKLDSLSGAFLWESLY